MGHWKQDDDTRIDFKDGFSKNLTSPLHTVIDIELSYKINGQFVFRK